MFQMIFAQAINPHRGSFHHITWPISSEKSTFVKLSSYKLQAGYHDFRLQSSSRIWAKVMCIGSIKHYTYSGRRRRRAIGRNFSLTRKTDRASAFDDCLTSQMN